MPVEIEEFAAAPVAGGGPAPARYLNRELSLLDYVERVLAIAQDSRRPLLERVAFLSMSSFAVDDFFQIRVAGLKEQYQSDPGLTSPDGMTALEQLAAIRRRVLSIVERHSALYRRQLVPELAGQGIEILSSDELDPDDIRRLRSYFEERTFPVLTPLAVDPEHPFPYLSNLSLNLGVSVRDPLRRRARFARIKVPPLLPRFIRFREACLIPVEEVIALNLQALFPGMEVLGHHVFRVTRDNDLDLDDGEAEDLMVAIQAELRRQRRRARGVRLEIQPGMPPDMLSLLVRELELDADDVYVIDRLLDLTGLDMIARLPRTDLKPRPWTPTTQPRLSAPGGGAVDIFAAVHQGDILVHHPYDSFSTSVEAFIDEAANDRRVLAIKQTLYRTSGPDSPIVRSLVNAAESGIQVVALVELKARGDEQANIAWARRLEEAGVHVVYGLGGLKTHAKVALVVRREDDRIRRYVHVATGNYNPSTAATYEDVGLLTCEEEMGADVGEFFNYLTGHSRQRNYRRIAVAPSGIRKRLSSLIEAQAREGGKIVLKVNNLTDTGIIDALYQASGRGAEVNLLVRGICCLWPQRASISEGIRVRSVVGRLLEHSRIFQFGAGAESEVFITSADLMDRNLDRRVELMAPILDPGLAQRVRNWLEVTWRDRSLSWELGADGRWRQAGPGDLDGVHGLLRQQALELSGGR